MNDLKAWEDKIEVDMFVDTEECRPLIEEIGRLRVKNEELETEIERLRFHLNWPPRQKSYSDGTDYKR